MSLFPAYSREVTDNKLEFEVVCMEDSESGEHGSNVSPALEAQLLASDNDEERDATPRPPTRRPTLDTDEYYLDRKLDCGNLRVSTLYYPGRPQYETRRRSTLGGAAAARRRSRRRYFEAPRGADDTLALDAELADRTRAFRRALAAAPADEALWLKFIDFQERCRDAEAALAAADEAAQRSGGARVCAERHRLRARALPPQRCLELLRAELAAARDPPATLELWLRLLDALAQRGRGAELDAAAGAALAATRALPPAYPHVLYAYGGYLRAAGLWERLVMLLELVTSMNFPPDAFPPPPDSERLDAVERDLHETEDKLIASGLPLSTVWVRAERARAAAHWRAGPGAADPQRAPLPADVAELLRPALGPDAQALLLLTALRLAKVPLLPAAGYALAAADAARDARGDPHWAACGEALLALLRAARRLPPAHPARHGGASAARRLLALLVDPPHYFSDDTGYSRWVNALWEASWSWSAGVARVALTCWRLRWLHAQLLLLEPGAEVRRLRGEARAALKRCGATCGALPYVQFARLEATAAGAACGRRAALLALRSALREGEAPERLYAARVLREVCGARDAAPAWGTACAALGRPLPPDADLERAPPAELLAEALRECEERCTRLEERLNADDGAERATATGARLLAAMLPHDAEWAAARVRLAPAPRRAELRAAVLGAAGGARGAEAARYWEQSACALAAEAAREHRTCVVARDFAPLFPHNALLALASGGGPLWTLAASAAGAGGAGGARSHVGALARAWPALLRAAAADWRGGGAGGARGALLAALDELPAHKWVYVRGAAWCGAEAAALADVLLERELRAHALPDELRAPTA
ncbi:uncharacterized protein LOC142976263 [Anticarsia gemmatalis]|uniref:uncharacterized protein LOC142976263 n=1 Tax=Anticarsia gemmatalis TaxID=129554 RepID=UPI003F75FC66